MHFLGLDIGTSAVKAVLVDDSQQIVAQASSPLGIDQPRPGWFEQDPDAWWEASERAVAEVRAVASAAFADVSAIGLSGQMHGAVVLDATHRPVRPAFLWNDARATAECAELERAIPNIGVVAGVRAMPGFTAPKLLWLRKHEPASFAAMRHVLLAKDYVRLKLTGALATDMCDAAGTLLLDEARRDWSAPILGAVGVDPDALPRLLEGSAVSGSLRADVAARWGLRPDVIVAAGGGDIAAGAIGVGAISAGDSFISLGTSAQIFICRNDYAPKPETLIHAFAHALPGRWFTMAALLNGGGVLDWAARLFGADPAELAAPFGDVRAPSPVTFLPYLAGERTPHNDPEARGAFVSLDYGSSRDALVQAALEGVAFALADGFNALGEPTDPESLLPIIGGGARNGAWVRIIASAIGRPLARMARADAGPALGAARLARLAFTGEPPEAVCTKPDVAQIVEPDATLAAAYAERMATFRGLYRQLRRVREAMEDRPPAATP